MLLSTNIHGIEVSIEKIYLFLVAVVYNLHNLALSHFFLQLLGVLYLIRIISFFIKIIFYDHKYKTILSLKDENMIESLKVF